MDALGGETVGRHTSPARSSAPPSRSPASGDVSYLVEKGLSIPARDGVRLATDVYRPLDAGPLPVLLLRTPYDKERMLATTAVYANIPRLVQAGYVVVVQDVRGRFASEGSFEPFGPQEATDGQDAIAWAASQPWASGRVGTFGTSYQATTQLLPALAGPPALGAMALATTPSDFYHVLAYPGGAFALGVHLGWCLGVAQDAIARRVRRGELPASAQADALAELEAFRAAYERTPLLDQPVVAAGVPSYLTWLEHSARDEFWESRSPSGRYGGVSAPALHIGGWFDVFLRGTLENYVELTRAGNARQRLVVSPWAHGNLLGSFPELDFGPRASAEVLDLTGEHVRWFDRWLKDIAGEAEAVRDTSADRDRPVRIWVMGANEWRDEDAWPLPDTRYTAYYLRGGGRANSLNGDGRLSVEPPGTEPDDRYLADPRRPVPSLGGPTLLPGGFVAGPSDQRPVEARDDVLCYTTPPLERPLEVTGPLELILYAASSARDTDFAAKLVDVHPDGRAMLLADGILRARYRESFALPRPLEPGAVYQLRLDLGATSNVFLPGHRLRLELASSNFPRFDRNPQTGGAVASTRLDEAVPAINRVFHDAAHPSHLRLPVIDRA
jgi:uncharacterized protein